MAPRRNGNGNPSITSNTTLSFSLLGTIVAGSISIGYSLAQLGGLQSTVQNNAIADTTSNLRLEKEIERLDRVTTKKDNTEEYRKRIDDLVGRHDKELEKINSNIFRREEHLLKWQQFDQQFLVMQRQIDDTKRDLNAIFPTTKVMEEMLKRIDRLESRHIDSATR